MTVTEAVAKAKELFGIEPSAAYKGIETADDFVFAVQTDTTNQAPKAIGSSAPITLRSTAVL